MQVNNPAALPRRVLIACGTLGLIVLLVGWFVANEALRRQKEIDARVEHQVQTIQRIANLTGSPVRFIQIVSGGEHAGINRVTFALGETDDPGLREVASELRQLPQLDSIVITDGARHREALAYFEAEFPRIAIGIDGWSSRIVASGTVMPSTLGEPLTE